jgi:hypothetical protein
MEICRCVEWTYSNLEEAIDFFEELCPRDAATTCMTIT